ncbi:hypothetical protein HON86_03650 [Candidatus Woesearchaeota archaeon]|jgi:hypothetical protein|nr:hypothetical protein [Candidatus Woesearchaeota archaeon]MBT4835678.1 hypothetical protein [Candidatus Woesearchaeota archaeon]MBT6735300.1 hypothetical protein [Candidatus Woesearchaeota archaeon]MBT7169472.1 hypothetical protein [Candidatus Woesearchaeota archaeon]MBT7474682.1 hypothetical protein [Candidatus Woesearchaeota archaeon]
MNNNERYWKNKIISPGEFIQNPGDYLNDHGYIAHENNHYEKADVRYVKQIKNEWIDIVFSQGKFYDVQTDQQSRFINFDGPEQLIKKEINRLELLIEKVIQ